MSLRFVLQFVLGVFGFALIVELLSSEGQDTVDIAGYRWGAGALLLGFVIVVIAMVLVGLALPAHRGSRRINQIPVQSACSRCGWTATSSDADEARQAGLQHLKQAHRQSRAGADDQPDV